jgi:hypothetical protein
VAVLELVGDALEPAVCRHSGSTARAAATLLLLLPAGVAAAARRSGCKLHVSIAADAAAIIIIITIVAVIRAQQFPRGIGAVNQPLPRTLRGCSTSTLLLLLLARLS